MYDVNDEHDNHDNRKEHSMNESVTMTPDEWRDLNTLCRKVLAEAPPELRDHDLYNAVSLTGAFAASVIDHMEGN